MRRIVLGVLLALGLSAPALAGGSCGKTGAGFDAWKTSYAAEARAQGSFDEKTLTEVEAFLNDPRAWQAARAK